MPDIPDAVILCGGAGTRLRTVTGDGPKAMAAVNGRPFLELLLKQLRRFGFKRVILAVGYRQDVIRDHFGDSAMGLKIAYSPEGTPLGTGGAMRNAAHLVQSDAALIMNGDSYTDADLAEVVADYRVAKADVSMVVSPPDGRGDAGSVYVGPAGYVQKFAEKQGFSEEACINAGIYVVSRELLRSIPSGAMVSLENELFPRWLGEGSRLKAFVGAHRCVDIGTPDRYQSAQQILATVERELGEPNREGQI